MVFKSIVGMACAYLAVVSFNASATIINNLNGNKYEWLELTETQGMSRIEVENQLSNQNSNLYGYAYASRSLLEELYLSYSTWDGINGYHGDSAVLSGISQMMSDFGHTYENAADGIFGTFNTVDNYTVEWDGLVQSEGLYGLDSECITSNFSCTGYIRMYYDTEGTPTMVMQDEQFGWNATYETPSITFNTGTSVLVGSYLVKEVAVPEPPVLWLIGSGLIGLIGVARRKTYA